MSHTPEWGWVAWATDHPSANKVDQHDIPESGGEEARTRNSKLEADGVIMVTSCAVEALCMAFGPMEAKETLPTRTFHATVRDWKDVLITIWAKI